LRKKGKGRGARGTERMKISEEKGREGKKSKHKLKRIFLVGTKVVLTS
jgi:hypothetical protein